MRYRRPMTQAERKCKLSESWGFLTSHAKVLLQLYLDPDLRLREVAIRVGMTERGVQRCVAELAAEGYLEITPSGRRNTYKFKLNRPMRPADGETVRVADLLDCISRGN